MAFPGAVLFVQLKDSTIVHKAYGFHTYDSLRKVQTHHLLDLASVTKVTGATLALMKLYDMGLIRLDNPINQYFPEIKGKRGKVTIRALLAHQSGWQSWIAYHQEIRDKHGELKKKYVASTSSERYDFKLAEGKYLRSDFYERIKKFISKNNFNPEQGYVYSGLFFYLVPELVQKLTNQDFEAFLSQHFFEPLGAKSLVFNPLTVFADSLILPTEVDTFFREQAIHGWVHDEGAIMMRGISGNAGLFGNAADVGRVWQMLLNDGVVGDTFLLKPNTIQLFTSAQYPGQGNRRGLGFDKPLLEFDAKRSSVAKDASFRSFGHTGYTGPIVWADPDNDLLFVFLCNRVYPTRNQRMLYEMNLRPTVHQWLYEAAAIISERSQRVR